MVAGLITREPRLLTSSLYADPERVRTLKVSHSFLFARIVSAREWMDKHFALGVERYIGIRGRGLCG